MDTEAFEPRTASGNGTVVRGRAIVMELEHSGAGQGEEGRGGGGHVETDFKVYHTRALSLLSTALLLLLAVSGNSATVLLRELDSAAAGLLRELELGADS